jgi:hypothetical protein
VHFTNNPDDGIYIMFFSDNPDKYFTGDTDNPVVEFTDFLLEKVE